VAEGLHGIDAERAARGSDSGGEAHSRNREHRRRNHHGIAGTGLIDDAGQHIRAGHAQCQSGGRTGRYQDARGYAAVVPSHSPKVTVHLTP